MSKIVAIGDIHGEHNKLTQLFWRLNSKVDFDKVPLVFLGDYVDGGPDTNITIHSLMLLQKMYPHWVFLYGNHEDMMLKALEAGVGSRNWNHWWLQGGEATAQSYNFSKSEPIALARRLLDYIPEHHLDWLRNLPLYHENESFIFVHAGLKPGVPLAEQRWIDLLWIRDEFIDSQFDFGKRVIFGHTAFDEPLVMLNKIGIDTQRFHRGEITAAILDDRRPTICEFVTSGE